MVPTRKSLLETYYGSSDIRKVAIDFVKDTFKYPPLEEWSKITLPYYAPGIEKSMPSISEIEEGMRTTSLKQSGGLFQVCLVRDCYVVKRGNSPVIVNVSIAFLFINSGILTYYFRKPRTYSSYRHTQKSESQSCLQSIPTINNST